MERFVDTTCAARAARFPVLAQWTLMPDYGIDGDKTAAP
jgi:hypothetical protein